MQHHARDVDMLAEQPLAGSAINLADARTRHLVHDADLLGYVQARQPLGQRLANGGHAERRRARGQFHHGSGATPPASVGHAEHVGVRDAGDAHEGVHDLGGVHVLAARDEHVGGTLANVQAALVQGRRVASQEKAVHGESRPRVGITAEHPGAAQGQAAETALIGVHDTGGITR